MEGIIRGDQTWVYGHDPQTKRHSSQWKSPGSPRLRKQLKIGVFVKTKYTYIEIIH
jgi:hypothetical protein